MKIACLAAATELLALVRNVPRMDSFIFPEYILPAFASYATDTNVGIRIAFANHAPTLGNAALRFHRLRWDLEIADRAARDAEAANAPLPPSSSAGDMGMTVAGFLEQVEANEEGELKKLRRDFKKSVVDVLTDEQPAVRRAILNHVLHLATFFGETMTDELLPHIISSLNDRDWELRAAFFDNITAVAICVGKTAVADFILPCILQALADFEQFVIENALKALAVLYNLQLLEKQEALEVLERNVCVMLCHPTLPVRASAVGCVLGAAKQLSMVEVHCRLLPILRPFLKTADIVLIEGDSLLEELRPPLSQEEYEKLVHNPYMNAPELLS